MHLVRLTASQKRVKKITHPLLKDCKSYSLEELEEMVARKVNGGPPDELVMALRSIVRYLVGRYCWHWPSTRPYIDDMVSEGMLAIVKLVRELGKQPLKRDIMYMASLRARKSIERMLNAVQSNAAPSFTTQETLIREGKKPVYLATARDVEDDDKFVDKQENLFDILESIAALRLDCQLATQVMDPDNWHMNDVELADKLGVDRLRVFRCRTKLLEQYRSFTGDQE
jgi:DNA-directed RNA polymerase specialized sigma subunit